MAEAHLDRLPLVVRRDRLGLPVTATAAAAAGFAGLLRAGWGQRGAIGKGYSTRAEDSALKVVPVRR